MELVLARDNVDQVLGYLTPRELYLYGSLSKTCNQSAEREWKRRLVQKCRHKEQLDRQCGFSAAAHQGGQDMFFWRNNFRKHFQDQYEEMQNLISFKHYYIKDIVIQCEYLILNPEFFLLKPFSELIYIVKERLKTYFYELDYEMYDIANIYFQRLFPKEYMRHLISDLYPDENYETRKEEDVF